MKEAIRNMVSSMLQPESVVQASLQMVLACG
jgi:hypothetical protein